MCSSKSNILIREDIAKTGISILTLNKPEKYNVLSSQMLDALRSELDSIAADESIRVLIMGAAGKTFCSGHDLKEIQMNTHQLFAKCSQVMMNINKLPQPVIAMVQGVATAAGCQLVASCDLAVASEDARFGVSGINIGLFCSTPAVALSRNIHKKHAMQMLLTGELISSNDALSFAIGNNQTSNMISLKSSDAVRLGKKMFYEQLQMDLESAYAYATERIVCNMEYENTKKGIHEFLTRPTTNKKSGP
ncbi:hypothetical protein ACHAWO_005920 [Cyclotella atomus]|uniref:Enoyl-CoA hydratase domain-containing protein 3, mitochondrial n=1 Tax=Cyclotella atomus TaxID=382360 RepID=A0ABD3NKN3_9STRA